MKKLLALTFIVSISAGMAMAQSKAKVAATQAEKTIDKQAPQAKKAVAADKEIETVERRAAKAKRVTSLETSEQMKARSEQKRTKAQPALRIGSADQ